MREGADGLVEHNSAMVEDFLEVDYSFVPTMGVMRLTEPHNLDSSTLADFARYPSGFTSDPLNHERKDRHDRNPGRPQPVPRRGGRRAGRG
jgi:hypothetical protein